MSKKLASTNYGDLKIDTPGTKLDKLGVNILTKNSHLITEEIPEQTMDRFHSMGKNEDFVLQHGDDIYYKDVDVSEGSKNDLVSHRIDDLSS